MHILQDLEPAKVFSYFEKICSIPHTSFHEKQLSDYCVNFAKEHNLYYEQDEMGNVLIVADATAGYEDAPAVMLQGHLDMVGDKTAKCNLDLEKDGLKLYIDGDYIRAKGTTLGADDGIAVAYALTILDDSSIPHPRLEVVLTVCEEVGLLGATAMDLSSCKARRLINVDSEVEGILTAGCAGGIRVCSELPITRTMRSGIVTNFTLEGLMGGHSGIEIHKGRANSNVLLGRFLLQLNHRVDYDLISIKGGAKENVIPKTGSVSLLIKENDIKSTYEVMNEFTTQMSAEYGTADPGIHLIMKQENEVPVECSVIDKDSLSRILAALNTMPNGVQAMSMDLPGLVETSLNLGVISLSEDTFTMRFSIRSSVPSAKEYITSKVTYLTQMLGGWVSFSGEYPAWSYERESRFRDICVSLYKKQYGKEPKIELMHAGLECGIIADKLSGIDCISFGPNLIDVHTPNEHMSISSVARVWEFLKAILAYRE